MDTHDIEFRELQAMKETLESIEYSIERLERWVDAFHQFYCQKKEAEKKGRKQ